MFVFRKINSRNPFSLVSHVWYQYGKQVNGNLIPVKTENGALAEESVFLLINKGKHFPFFLITHIFLKKKSTRSTHADEKQTFLHLKKKNRSREETNDREKKKQRAGKQKVEADDDAGSPR